MNKLYTAQEVADRLKIKKTTVYELIKRGELSSSKIGKQLRISEEQLAEYLKGTVSDSEQRPASPDFRPESSLLKRDYLLNSSGLIISGQAPSVMELLMGQMAAHPLGLPILHSHMNSYNGLYSLYFGKVHAAAAGVLPAALRRGGGAGLVRVRAERDAGTFPRLRARRRGHYVLHSDVSLHPPHCGDPRLPPRRGADGADGGGRLALRLRRDGARADAVGPLLHPLLAA